MNEEEARLNHSLSFEWWHGYVCRFFDIDHRTKWERAVNKAYFGLKQ